MRYSKTINFKIDSFLSNAIGLRIRTCKANYCVNDLENERGISFCVPWDRFFLKPILFSFSLSYFSSTFSLSASRQKRKKMNVSISFYRTNKRQCLERHSLLLLSSPFSYGWVYQYKTSQFYMKAFIQKASSFVLLFIGMF